MFTCTCSIDWCPLGCCDLINMIGSAMCLPTSHCSQYCYILGCNSKAWQLSENFWTSTSHQPGWPSITRSLSFSLGDRASATVDISYGGQMETEQIHCLESEVLRVWEWVELVYMYSRTKYRADKGTLLLQGKMPVWPLKIIFWIWPNPNFPWQTFCLSFRAQIAIILEICCQAVSSSISKPCVVH